MVTLLSALQPWVNAATSVFVVGTEKTAAIGLVADLSVLVIVQFTVCRYDSGIAKWIMVVKSYIYPIGIR